MTRIPTEKELARLTQLYNESTKGRWERTDKNCTPGCWCFGIDAWRPAGEGSSREVNETVTLLGLTKADVELVVAARAALPMLVGAIHKLVDEEHQASDRANRLARQASDLQARVDELEAALRART